MECGVICVDFCGSFVGFVIECEVVFVVGCLCKLDEKWKMWVMKCNQDGFIVIGQVVFGVVEVVVKVGGFEDKFVKMKVDFEILIFEDWC